MPGLKTGHARVAAAEQNPDLHRSALEAAGCERVFAGRGIAGADSARPGRAAALAALGPGDGAGGLEAGSPRALARATPRDHRRHREGRGRVSVPFREHRHDNRRGRPIFHVRGALAAFERSLIGEQTRAGMRAAQRRGKPVGRPRQLSAHQLDPARALIETGQETRAGVAELFGVDVATLRRALGKISV